MKRFNVQKLLLLIVLSSNAYAVDDISAQWIADDYADLGNCPGYKILTNPTRKYIDHGDGTVTDKVTGLMWKKCHEGQTYDAGAPQTTKCGGALDFTQSMTWEAAFDRLKRVNEGTVGESFGYNDWRIPTIHELQSITMTNCENPSLNEVIFPGRTGDPGILEVHHGYWSSTVNTRFDYYGNEFGGLAFRASFFNGLIYPYDKNQGEQFVMLVRDPK